MTSEGTYLVHASIGKEKGGVLIWDRGRGRDVSMTFGLKIIKKSLTNLHCGEGAGLWGSHGVQVSLIRPDDNSTA